VGDQAAGTPAFMAPELFHADLTSEYDPFSADIYSLGATLYTLAVGFPPFMAKNEQELVNIVQSQAPVFPACVFP
jgi:serine/threonine protein kinase